MIIELKDAENLDELINDNENVLVDFYTDWCGPCIMLGKTLEKISDKTDEVTIVKVNAEHHVDISRELNIRGVPTLYFYVGGELKDTHIGSMSEKNIMEQFNLDKEGNLLT